MTGSPYDSASLARCFGLPEAPVMSIVPLGAVALVSAYLQGAAGLGAGRTVVLAPQRAHLLMVYRADAWHCDLLPDGQQAPARLYPAGSICLVDLRDGAAIALRSDLEVLAFIIADDLLSELVRTADLPPVYGLRCRRAALDPVLVHLATAWLALMQAETLSDAVLCHVARGICLHLVQAYGLAAMAGPAAGGPPTSRLWH
ncbi:hypothetical protein [Rhizobium rhizosphaerae]|nr:hypothetical protein [Xaviernesmea rhizosphaerae]